MNTEGEPVVLDLDEDALNAIHRVKFASDSLKNCRPSLVGVTIESGWAMATDAYRFAAHPIDVDVPYPVRLPIDALPETVGRYDLAVKDDRPCPPWWSVSSITGAQFNADGPVVYAPELAAVMPKRRNTFIVLGPSFRAGRGLGVFYEDGTMSTFSDFRGRIGIAAFEGRLLRECLRAFPGDVRLSVPSTSEPATFVEDDDGLVVWLMPRFLPYDSALSLQMKKTAA